ncbi:MAG: restriction endonuclease subunit R [Leptolyngbya sp.]|nr:MAG: restriction endonuclease subunit R [Leptolyngbya sp.]
MVQSLQARNVTLRDLIDDFKLELVRNEHFFREWQDNLPEISEAEKAFLDRVKESYFNLIEYPPLLEKTVQITILGPLLFAGGFFLPPFHIRSEKSIEITAEDDGVIVRGQADLIILKDDLWVLTIESKENSFSVEVGLAQLLTYMLAAPDAKSHPSFGLIVAGGSFMFIKLVCRERNQYGRSRIFEIANPGDELYAVLAILKRLGQL